MVQSSNNSHDNILAALIEAFAPQPAKPTNDALAALFLSPPSAKPRSQASNYLALADALTPTSRSSEPAGNLFSLGASLPPTGNTLSAPDLLQNSLAMSFLRDLPKNSLTAYTPRRRKTFFSFHYADIMRVNNVRNAFKIYNPPTGTSLTFFDSSLWESRKLEGDEALKRMIREGVQNTSVVCVLIGTETWKREWVRYEIARSVIDRKGLLAIDINGLNHHRLGAPHARGHNPLSFMAVGKMRDGTYRLFERRWDIANGEWMFGWFRYAKYTGSVELPEYLADPDIDYVSALDNGTTRYDFVQQQGSRKIGEWIDLAAVRASR